MRYRDLPVLALLLVLPACVHQGAPQPPVAHWTFDGNMQDLSDWGRNLKSTEAKFVVSPRGQAWNCGREIIEVASQPELELAPGLRVECWVKFAEQPTGYQSFVAKEGEYMLRVDPPSEGSRFAFFVKLDGSWEPRVSSPEPVKTDVWYHVVAAWDGRKSTLQVNGRKQSIQRSGAVRPSLKPLEIGAVNGMIDELRIENPIMRNPRTKAGESLVASWPFDGGLGDSSGRGHDLTLASARFVPGRDGQALRFGAEEAVLADTPDLQLAPNLRIECDVRYDEKSEDYRPIVFKDGEYLLRVDSLKEGGRFSFFVHQGKSWGPKALSEEPMEVGRWYHLVAEWNGVMAVLEVDGRRSVMRRSGPASPGDAPLRVGTPGLVIDNLRIGNPAALQMAELRAMIAAAAGSNAPDHFGEGAGWPGWVGVAGARASVSKDRLDVRFGDSGAMVVNPGFDLDLSQCRYVCCDVQCDAARSARLTFITDTGHGSVAVPVWAESRTSIVDLADVPGWQGRLKLLAISVPGVRPYDVRLENLWVSAEPVGKPFLQVRNLAQGEAILQVGRPAKITAVVQNLGMEAREATARLALPESVACADGMVRELGTIPAGAVKTAEWTVTADSLVSERFDVVLAAANAAPSSAQYRLVTYPVEEPTEAQPRVAQAAGAYYIDSRAGDNANSGRSADSPWRDFSNINGKTLGPGEKLLIKRGSVINQELQVSVRGTADNWVEIGPYGTGARPLIQRNWDIQDRCALIRSPDYLWVHGLAVSRAAKGLIVHYTESGHAGLLIEDCIASHIEGLYYQDNHGIPEWRGKPGPVGDATRSAGIGVTGASAEDVTLRDCEMFHTSQGFRMSQSGKRVVIDRVYCHDCYAHNTSPHPILIGGRLVKNSIFDASGGHASRGTMGIMLGGPRGVTFRNCTFRNMPDSGSHDQGGVDFEAGGDGCLIDDCTFENNAGAGIEVLGLKSPQCRNIEIRDSRFIKNNWVHKSHGPAEIYVWGSERNPDPVVCCSTGTVHDNGYVLAPGVEFFINAVPGLTWWELHDNVQYATAEELRKAMPRNEPPVVDAGPDLCSDTAAVRLAGSVRDDGKGPKARWEVMEGPADVAFAGASSAETTATFAQPGDYLLRLVGDDGELWTSDMVNVHVLPPGSTVAKTWEFSKQLDKEGWTEANLGTREEKVGSKSYEVAQPVKHVCGGFYIVAVENSTNASLLSPDDLAADLGKCKTITIAFQNHTPATRMRFSFTTSASPAWSEANSKTFEVTANDNGSRQYVVDMSAVAGWTGSLKQLRLDLGTGTPVTGTCRIDYIQVGNVR